MADSALMMESANLLLAGPQGKRDLIQRVRKATGERRRAAALTMLYSGDPAFVPTLVPLIEVRDADLSIIGGDAIQIDPKAAWPILLKMANAGSVNAVSLISHYRPFQTDTLAELTRHSEPEVRIRALQLLNSIPHLERAIDDENHLVVRAAVERFAARKV